MRLLWYAALKHALHVIIRRGDVASVPLLNTQVSTLSQSKSGKQYSDKMYRVSVLGVKPAAFGTTKKES